MKVAIIGDQHFGVRSDNQQFLSYMQKYYEEEFFPRIDSEGVEVLIHTGDIFDRRKYVNFYTLKRTREMFFDELANRNIDVHAILGNHDVAYKNTNELNSIELLLEKYSNLHVYSKPKRIEVDNRSFGMVPWVNSENYDSSVSFISSNKDVDMLIGHFDIQGVEMIRGVHSEEGFSQEFFSDYSRVISGHYHTPSINGNIWYPGSPLEFTWADYGQDKGYLLYDTKTNELSKISTQTRMFFKIYYDDTDEFELKRLQNTLNRYKGSYVKVIVRNKQSRQKFDAFMSQLHAAEPFDVKVIESDFEFGLSENEMNVETQTTTEIVDSTIDNMELNVSKAELKKLFRELYSESLNIEV